MPRYLLGSAESDTVAFDLAELLLIPSAASQRDHRHCAEQGRVSPAKGLAKAGWRSAFTLGAISRNAQSGL